MIMDGVGPGLLEHDWLKVFKLKWAKICHIGASASHEPVVEQYPEVFRSGLGRVKNMTAKIHVDPLAQSKFFKPRSVPYVMKGKVELELGHLQKEGIIEPVEFSDWAAPIVPVLKSDGQVRICGDYKLTVNQAAKLDGYPIPRIDDLDTILNGGQTFMKLDLSSAYLQLE